MSSSPNVLKAGDTVLIAVDGSEYSDYAIDFYMKSLHKPENAVILAHATELKTITSPAVAVMTGDINMTMVTQEIESEEKKTAELVDTLTKRMNKLNVNATVEHTHGEPGPTICTIATHKKVDYIVIGCRGKNMIRRTFTGSVTDYVTHHSHVPVLVARHKDHLKHHHGIHLKNPFKHKESHE